MSNDTASVPDGDAFLGGPEYLEYVFALLVVWAQEEWSRVGEVLLFDRPGVALSVGRGDESPGGHRRARPVQQRPAENTFAPPLASTATSRDQLLVTARVYGLDVENVGKTKMIVDGTVVERCRLGDGDFVQVHGQFLLRCIRRRRRLPPARHFLAKYYGAFGQPNAFGMVGETPEMHELYDQLAFAAKLPAHVRLHGQTGTGKEPSAAAIHGMGPTPRGPFVSASVGNVPRSLLEDELFGHRKDHPQAGMDPKKGLVGEERRHALP